MGTHADRYRQRWLDRSGCNRRNVQWTRIACLAQSRLAGLRGCKPRDLGGSISSCTIPRSVIAADIDGDGAADLIVTQLDAPPIVLHNVGGNHNHSLRLTLAGLADNKTAIGTKVEVFSNGRSQKFEIAGSSGYLGQGSTEIIARARPVEQADIVRLLVADRSSAG